MGMWQLADLDTGGRKCERCWADMEGRRPQARYCSDRCRVAASRSRDKPIRNCTECDEPIDMFRRADTLYCSDACRQRARSDRRLVEIVTYMLEHPTRTTPDASQALPDAASTPASQ